MDVDLDLDARVALTSSHHVYTLAYTPRLSFLDVNAVGFQPALLNGLLASAEWRTGHATILVSEVGSYGERAIASLGTLTTPGTPVQTPPNGQTAANAQLVPTVEQFLYVSSLTNVSSALTLKHWVLTGMVGYQLSGGADASAQQDLPFQYGPTAEAIADFRATRRDHLITDVSALQATFSAPAGLPSPAPTTLPPKPWPLWSTAGGYLPGTGTELALVEEQEKWKHAWTRATDTIVSAGMTEARSRDAAFAPYVFSTYPMVEASFEQRFGRGKAGTSLIIDARLAPLVNQLTGIIDERVQASVTGTWTRRKATLGVSVTAAESTDMSTAYASQLLMGEVDASYAHSPALSFDMGARVLTQEQNTATTLPNDTTGPVTQATFGQAIFFVAVTVRPVKATF